MYARPGPIMLFKLPIMLYQNFPYYAPIMFHKFKLLLSQSENKPIFRTLKLTASVHNHLTVLLDHINMFQRT